MFALERLMQIVRAVRDARAGGPGSLCSDGVLGAADACRLEGQTEIVVGAGEQDSAASRKGLGRRHDLVHADAERVCARPDQLFAQIRKSAELVEQVHVYFAPLSLWKIGRAHV